MAASSSSSIVRERISLFYLAQDPGSASVGKLQTVEQQRASLIPPEKKELESISHFTRIVEILRG